MPPIWGESDREVWSDSFYLEGSPARRIAAPRSRAMLVGDGSTPGSPDRSGADQGTHRSGEAFELRDLGGDRRYIQVPGGHVDV